LKKKIPKQKGLFEIKEIFNLPNHCPELPNNWRIYSIFHTSLPSSYKENDAHEENFIEPLPEPTKEEEYKIKLIIPEEKDLPILTNEKVTPLENILKNWNIIYSIRRMYSQYMKDDVDYS
jgi:hypothetical protein